MSKPITIAQFVHALQRQGDGTRVLLTYNPDDQHRVNVESMDLLCVIVRELAEAIEDPNQGFPSLPRPRTGL